MRGEPRQPAALVLDLGFGTGSEREADGERVTEAVDGVGGADGGDATQREVAPARELGSDEASGEVVGDLELIIVQARMDHQVSSSQAR